MYVYHTPIVLKQNVAIDIRSYAEIIMSDEYRLTGMLFLKELSIALTTMLV